ncbi:hypothetical protein B6U93_00370 [Candidatus Woesearchaeota archaeon ex4484_78]|nr:MAG: hypothetical protein B6U93_00370 [Candidatus Woesearchaeota archaeon ex4484_78]
MSNDLSFNSNIDRKVDALINNQSILSDLDQDLLRLGVSLYDLTAALTENCELPKGHPAYALADLFGSYIMDKIKERYPGHDNLEQFKGAMQAYLARFRTMADYKRWYDD